MNTLIKWPGGKSGEINKIEGLFPKHERYVEPFFGGGAVFFHLQPQNAIINDISQSLMEYYELIKNQDKHLYDLLVCYSNSFESVMNVCVKNYNDIHLIYNKLQGGEIDTKELGNMIKQLTTTFVGDINHGFSENLLLDEAEFISHINKMVADKMIRTVKNNDKAPFNDEDLKNNLILADTGEQICRY